MKEIDKITIRIEKLFNDLQMPELYAHADCFFSFGYDTDNIPTVFYSIIEEDDEIEKICDKLYSEFYTEHTHKVLPVSAYTFSILHEVGHHKTMHMFSEQDIKEYRKACKQLMKKSNLNMISDEQVQKKYMDFPVEKAATLEACKLVQQNIKLLKQFEKDMIKLFENLQKTLDNEN